MIEGKKVRLRSFELSDLDEIMKHWNNMELSARVDILLPFLNHVSSLVGFTIYDKYLPSSCLRVVRYNLLNLPRLWLRLRAVLIVDGEPSSCVSTNAFPSGMLAKICARTTIKKLFNSNKTLTFCK